MPPPAAAGVPEAEFPTMVTLEISSTPPLLKMPPPKELTVRLVAKLPETVLSPIRSVPEFAMPPPLIAESPEIVASITVSVPEPQFSMPPPREAELPEIVLSATVSAPKLSMPPPLSHLISR